MKDETKRTCGPVELVPSDIPWRIHFACGTEYEWAADGTWKRIRGPWTPEENVRADSAP